MPSADLCTEEEIVELVHRFYDKVRQDEVLGPVFGRHVKNWDAHLPTMVDFWSSALRGTARFRGSPMPRHAALPGLSIALFQRWFRGCSGKPPTGCRMRPWLKRPTTWPSALPRACGTATR